MPNLELWIPVTPYVINQKFGSNPDYYARFLDAFGNPEKGHMGIDLQASHGQPVYAPITGNAFYVEDSHGGDGLYIRTPDGKYMVILWHLCSKNDPQFKPLIPADGKLYPVKCGELIAYADNTGAPFESSGDHLHVGLLPIDASGSSLYPGNGFGGCIDPLPFFNGKFATDYEATEHVIEDATETVKEVATAPIPVEQKKSLLAYVADKLSKLLIFLQK